MTKQEFKDQLKQEADKYINEIKTKIEMENEKSPISTTLDYETEVII